MSQTTLIRDARVLDVRAGAYLDHAQVLVSGGFIAEVGDDIAAPDDAEVIDAEGRALLPGLIDGHVHVIAVHPDLGAVEDWAASYVTARAARIMRDMLHRGFTTVRDLSGADHGHAAAQAEGYIEGPRLLFCGKAVSQTGGHADMRPRGRMHADTHPGCPSAGIVCDGVPEVRRAVRQQLRTGADHIKLMLSGGVASPTDRIDSTQLAIDEIRAAVEEADAANRYVAGHAYTAKAVNRGLENGVRSIEHGNLIDQSSIDLFLRHDAFYVPTLVTYHRMSEEGLEHGLPEDNHRKVGEVLGQGLHALDLAHRAGVQVVFGTDLLGDMHRHQSEEFAIRAQVQPGIDVIRSATVTAAKLIGYEGRLGEVVAGAHADLILVDGDPVADVTLLARPEQSIRLIMQAGRIVRAA